MKKKTLNLKKLVLNKEHVMALGQSEQSNVLGGRYTDMTACQHSCISQCLCDEPRFTVDPPCCRNPQMDAQNI
jgi:hypothetical protein